MIYEVTMYACKCDNCGAEWHDDHYGWCAVVDESSLEQLIDDEDGWERVDDKHYCPNCYGGYDDDDNLIIKNE